MANVSQNLRNRLHTNVQNYTRSRLKDGKANSANLIKTIDEIINVIHRGKVPEPRPRINNLPRPPNLPPRPRRNNLPRPPNLPPRPRRNNLPNNNRNRTRADSNALTGSNSVNNTNRNRTIAGFNALPGPNSVNNTNRNRTKADSNIFHNAQSNQPWLYNMAESRGRVLMNNMRSNSRNSK